MQLTEKEKYCGSGIIHHNIAAKIMLRDPDARDKVGSVFFMLAVTTVFAIYGYMFYVSVFE